MCLTYPGLPRPTEFCPKGDAFEEVVLERSKNR